MILKRLSFLTASLLLVGASCCTTGQLIQPAEGNQLLKKYEVDRADPKIWEFFDPNAYPDKTLLVPRPEALQQGQLMYNARPSYPYNPVTTPSVIYGRGKDQPPSIIFVKAGDPVVINGKVYWSSMLSNDCKQVLLDSGDTVDIWTVSAYTPMLDYSGVANVADIQPWRPDRVFKKGNWQDLIFTDANESITISGQQFTAPAAGEKIVVKVKDKEGKNHQVTLWSIAANAVQPNKSPKLTPATTTTTKRKKKKSSAAGSTGAATPTPAGTSAAPATPAPAGAVPASSAPAGSTPASTTTTPAATTPAATPAASTATTPSTSAPSASTPATSGASSATPSSSASGSAPSAAAPAAGAPTASTEKSAAPASTTSSASVGATSTSASPTAANAAAKTETATKKQDTEQK